MNSKTAKNIDDLRDVLFTTLERLLDQNDPMDVSRARVICEVAREVTASAKVEVEFINATGGKQSPFLSPERETSLPAGITGRTVHRLGA